MVIVKKQAGKEGTNKIRTDHQAKRLWIYITRFRKENITKKAKKEEKKKKNQVKKPKK